MTRLHAVLAPTYVTAAVLAFVATFLPLWSSEDVEAFGTMSLWGAAGIDNAGGGIARTGLVLALLLIVLLFASAAWVEVVPVLPTVAAVLCIPGVFLLVTKPLSSTPKPDLGSGGAVLLGLTIVVIVAAVVHVVSHTVVAGRRRPTV